MQFDEEMRLRICPYTVDTVALLPAYSLNVQPLIVSEWKTQTEAERELVPLGYKRRPDLIAAAKATYQDKTNHLNDELFRVWLN
ncbi:MAG TPA: hypothetical protein VD794_08635 [Flavisolibacter sp.]|nr:hypothetical protein [Flavisolibacter sp.]